MKKKSYGWLWFLLALVIVIWLASADIAFATDDCRGNQPCNSDNIDIDVGGTDIDIGDTNVPVDVTVPVDVNAPTEVNVQGSMHKSRALALSNSLGDVDIAGCLGSTQWATPLFSKQKLVLNWPCMAEFYLVNQQYGLAAMAICNTAIVKEFEDEAACEIAHNFSYVAEVNDPEPPPPPPPVNDDEDEHEEHDQLKARLEALESKREQDARRSRAYAAEQRKKEAEEKEFARQIYQQYQQVVIPEGDK